MKKQIYGMLLALILIMNLFGTFNSANVLAASAPNSKATNVSVFKAGTNLALSPQRGSKVDVYVTISDPNLRVSDFKGLTRPVYAVKYSDSFNNPSGTDGILDGSIKDVGNGIIYRIKFANLEYTGNSNKIVFDLIYGFKGADKIPMECKVPNCVEYNFSDYTGSKVAMTVTDVTFPGNITAGDNIDVSFNAIPNQKDVLLKNVVLEYTTTDGLDGTAYTNKITLPNFTTNGPNPISLNFDVKKAVESGRQILTLKFTYDYRKNGELKEGESTTEVVRIPVTGQNSDDADVPYVVMDSYRYGNAVQPGKNFTLTYVLRNKSTRADISNLSVVATPSDGLISRSASNRMLVKTLGKGRTSTQKLNLKVSSDAANGYQTVTFKIDYNYMKNGKPEAVSVTESVMIAVKAPANNTSKPYVILQRYDYGGIVTQNKEFTLTSSFQNENKYHKVENVTITYTTSDGIFSRESSNKIFISKLEPGAKQTIPLKFKANSELTTGNQTVTFTIKYDYPNGSKMESMETTETAIIGVKGKKSNEKEVGPETPYVMVSKYEYGGKVPAGKIFKLKLWIKNTSKSVKMENLVMSLQVAEGLSITSSSNTFYFDKLGANGVQQQVIEMQALPNAKSVSTSITVSFKYEFINKKSRESVTSTETISIPIYQPDRMELVLQDLPQSVNAGEEIPLSVQYVNKGKSSVYNVSAEITGNLELDPQEKKQNLGNFDSGASGSIDFMATASTPGTTSGEILISYEDDNMEVKEFKIPYSVEVMEAPVQDPNMDPSMDPNMNPEEMEPQKDSKKTMIIGVSIGGAVVLALIVTIVVVKLKKKKKRLLQELEDMQEDD